MRKSRQSRSQSLIQQNLLGSIRDVICPANNVRHPHIDIVCHHAQVISRPAIASQQHEVFQLRVRELDSPEDRVIK